MQRAGLVVGCYPERGLADPKVFITAMASVLECYPEDVVRRVTAPRTGITGRSKFLPSVAEVRQACEDEIEWARKVERRQKMLSDHVAQLEAPKSERPSIEDIKAKLGPDYGIERTGAIKSKAGKTLEELKAEMHTWDLTPSDELIANIAEKEARKNGEL
jgi:hypothetical protein